MFTDSGIGSNYGVFKRCVRGNEHRLVDYASGILFYGSALMKKDLVCRQQRFRFAAVVPAVTGKTVNFSPPSIIS